ncbi:cyclin-domain-containing protein [Xylaria sp. CBS 124048]|nr:cyclin-domain-containing protein [Xylaria sp. CBS 124048]
MPEADFNKQDAVQIVGETSDITPTLPPPRPVPSTDPKLISQVHTPPPCCAIPTESTDDIFKLPPAVALKLLCAGIESLVRITGDVPPTPPPTSFPVPNMSGMEKEKAAIVRSHSDKDLARLQQQHSTSQPHAEGHENPSGFFDGQQAQPDHDVHSEAPASTPTAATPQPYIIIGENSQPLNLQHNAITRKFYSKGPPPISIRDYLARIHRFCPMSTAVYLATSLYIFRLAVEERAIAVTRRNSHRLVLAGLRVAMKALEDLSYQHSKISKVGGVSEAELARLEISFCFLVGFELVVNEEVLQDHYRMLKQHTIDGNPGAGDSAAGTITDLTLNIRRKKKSSESGTQGAIAGSNYG